jgi:hypothetical protein
MRPTADSVSHLMDALERYTAIITSMCISILDCIELNYCYSLFEKLGSGYASVMRCTANADCNCIAWRTFCGVNCIYCCTGVQLSV